MVKAAPAQRSSPRKVIVQRVLAGWNEAKLTLPDGCKHLAAIDRRGRGLFVVLGCVNRKVFREMAKEGQAHGVQALTVYCRTCTYSGPSLDVVQIDKRGTLRD